MSTEYECGRDHENNVLAVVESSSRFDVTTYRDGTAVSGEFDLINLSAEELVKCAVKMIQPALYNVEDPERFYREVILPEIARLWR